MDAYDQKTTVKHRFRYYYRPFPGAIHGAILHRLWEVPSRWVIVQKLVVILSREFGRQWAIGNRHDQRPVGQGNREKLRPISPVVLLYSTQDIRLQMNNGPKLSLVFAPAGSFYAHKTIFRWLVEHKKIPLPRKNKPGWRRKREQAEQGLCGGQRLLGRAACLWRSVGIWRGCGCLSVGSPFI